MAEKERLTKNIQQTEARLKRAAKLTTGLADEQVRWAESVEVGGQCSRSVIEYTRMRNVLNCDFRHLSTSPETRIRD